MGSLIVIVAMFALLWLLLIRPQRAKQQQHDRMVESVDVGDEVLSSGGVYGLVRGVDDEANELHVEIAPGVEVRMDRRAVGTIVKKEEEEEEDENELEEAEDEPGEPVTREESVNPAVDAVNEAVEEDAATAAEPNRR